jgi:hypothetical protein
MGIAEELLTIGHGNVLTFIGCIDINLLDNLCILLTQKEFRAV